MKQAMQLPHKIYTLPALQQELLRWRLKNKSIVFTNGVFDLLHAGHLQSLSQAAALGDILIVGINADASVKRLKGDSRPVNDEQSRALILATLLMVDAVVIFEEDTPYHLITSILPDVLVKGGDYTIDTVVGAKEVMAHGGRVELLSLKEGFSTTGLIKKMNR
jgi:D-glycero-beta-D-manno-heptose 1-phosphate adenylyltransferase